MMKFLNLLVMTLAAVSTANAQEISLEKAGPQNGIEIQTVRKAGFHNWGFFVTNEGLVLDNFWGNPFTPGGEYPRGSGMYLVYTSELEIGVLKNPTGHTPEYRYTVSTFYNYLNGPVPLPHGVPFDSLDRDALDPFAGDNIVYLIDTSRSGDNWLNWPCLDGAPCDSSGDPLLISQQDTWCVFNDIDTLTGFCGRADSANCVPGPKQYCYGCAPVDSPVRGIGLEVQQSTHVFGPVPDVIFIHWKLFNRTNVPYDSAYVSYYIDPDIGNTGNDHVGTDTARTMLYSYSDAAGPTTTGLQYAAGAKILFFSGVPSLNSAHWKSAAYQYETPGPTYRVLNPIDTSLYFGMSGLDQDGTRRLVSEGLVEIDGSPFVFPGDPVTGQGVTSANLWPNGIGIHGTISVGPFQLQPGVEYDFIIAAIAGEDPDHLDAIVDLRNKADHLQAIFDNQIAYLLGVGGTFSEPEAEIGVSSTTALPRDTLYFFDWSLTNPQDPNTIWKWDFDNDGTFDYETITHGNRPKAWTYTDPGVYSPKLVVVDAAGIDSVIKDSLITVYGNITTPFSDPFDSPPEPNPATWINTTTHISDKCLNPPSGSYALALDANPDGPEKITSYPFDLSGRSDSFADTVLALRYWYEGKGNGNAPEPDDSLIVEFRNNLGAWIKAREYSGQSMSSFQPDSVFLDSIDPGPGATFYHDLFQFRFRGTSTPSSTSPHKDVWFVDDLYFGDIIVDIDPDQASGIPAQFKLHQNYPNPFNPSTKIKYDLPEDSRVTIRIYNVLGQEVRTLVDDQQTAGFRSVVWNGKNNSGKQVSSGVYVYRIEARDFVKSRKMMLLR